MSLSDLFILPATDTLRQAMEHYRQGTYLTSQEGKKELIADLMTMVNVARTFEINLRSDLTDSQLQIARRAVPQLEYRFFEFDRKNLM